jgi:hypothetical protein
VDVAGDRTRPLMDRGKHSLLMATDEFLWRSLYIRGYLRQHPPATPPSTSREEDQARSNEVDQISRIQNDEIEDAGRPIQDRAQRNVGRDNKHDTQRAGEPERRAVRQIAVGAFFRDRRAAPVLGVRMSRTVNWEGAWKTIQTFA